VTKSTSVCVASDCLAESGGHDARNGQDRDERVHEEAQQLGERSQTMDDDGLVRAELCKPLRGFR
jgi:hypothetical protein